MIAAILSFVVVLILTIVLWILFTPVLISADTTKGQLEIVQRGTFVIRWTLSGPEARIFGIKTSFTSDDESPAKKPATRKRHAFHRSLRSWQFLIRGCLAGISVRKFVFDVDTGDVVLNAELVPAMFFLSNGQVALSTNFDGRIYMHIEVEARLSKLLWTWVLFLTKK